MGELKFEQKGRDEQAMQAENEEGDATGKLLGIEGERLYDNICKPRIKVDTYICENICTNYNCAIMNTGRN
jgi:myosin heavy subunit